METREVKLTLEEVIKFGVELNGGVNQDALMSLEISFTEKYLLSRVNDQVQREQKHFDKAKESFINTHGELDKDSGEKILRVIETQTIDGKEIPKYKNGAPIYTATGRKYNAQIQELLNREVPIKVPTELNFEIFKDFKLKGDFTVLFKVLAVEQKEESKQETKAAPKKKAR